MNKYLKIALWLVAVVLIIVVLSFIEKKRTNTLCTSIEVEFSDTADYKYIDRNDIVELLESDGEKILGRPIEEINLAEIEKKVNAYPYIKHAEVYKNINGTLTIDAVQRNPLVRVINDSQRSFYIGGQGGLMPVSRKVQVRMVIATGNINFVPDFDTVLNIFDRKLAKEEDIALLKDLHTLVSYIDKNEFWKSQIQQIYITSEKEFEIVPLVGNHIVEFGTVDNYNEKFRNLEATYKKGFPSKGWNQFAKINLKYKNQVICSKAE